MRPPARGMAADLTAAASAITFPDSPTRNRTRSTQPASLHTEKARTATSAQHMQQNHIHATRNKATRTCHKTRPPQRPTTDQPSTESSISQTPSDQTPPASQTAAHDNHLQHTDRLHGAQCTHARETPSPTPTSVSGRDTVNPRREYNESTRKYPQVSVIARNRPQ